MGNNILGLSFGTVGNSFGTCEGAVEKERGFADLRARQGDEVAVLGAEEGPRVMRPLVFQFLKASVL
jgi:hypothetical protein